MPGKTSMVASAMQACCSCALSLYTCLLKQKFTFLWSHTSYAILLASALGTAEAVYTENFAYHIVSAVVVTIWASIIVQNYMAI